MDIEENDEVEREIDILFSGEFLNETKIFQFPLIPKSSMNTEKIKSLSASEDMKSMKMEMNLDQKYLDKNIYNVVPIKTLKGENIEYNSNLCLGIMKNNQLILTPISQFFQFRHDFSNINKERNLEIKIKKDKNERKNLNLEVKEDTKYNGLCVHQPQSMESKIVLERIASPEGEVKKANYMSKEEYYNLLLKYVITPDTSGDSNDDFLSLYKNASKESFLDTINEAKNENMIIEEEEEEKQNKKRGFSSGYDIIKSNEKEGSGNGIITNIINNIFEGHECLFYDDLLLNICSKMNIAKNDEEKIRQIKKGIEDNCIIVKENICFIKDIDDNDINEVRNLIIQEIGNNENGLKKQQIKKLIEQNELTITDSKLTKLLQKICKYSGNTWIIKPPVN